LWDGLESSEIVTATIGTTTDFTAYDVLMHDALTDTWIVDAIGAPEDNFDDQTNVPEPTAALLALVLAPLARRRHNLTPSPL
jgi:uncharacterized protein (TIGR03382 family)